MRYKLFAFGIISALLVTSLVLNYYVQAKDKNQGSSISRICINGSCTIEMSNSSSDSTVTPKEQNVTNGDGIKSKVASDIKSKLPSAESLFDAVH